MSKIKLNPDEAQMQQALAESQAREKELREVLEFYMAHGITESLYHKARKALSLPADYSALNEALAREDERIIQGLAARMKARFDAHGSTETGPGAGYYSYLNEACDDEDKFFISWLREEASKHRGQK